MHHLGHHRFQRELALAAWSAAKHHVAARDRQRRFGTGIGVDDEPREIDARRHAGRGPDVAVAHENRLGVDFDPRVKSP